MGADDLIADPHAQPAENAGVGSDAPARLLDPELRGQALQHRDRRAVAISISRLMRRALTTRGVSVKISSPSQAGIIAGRHDLVPALAGCAPPHADPAGGVRSHVRVVAEGWDLDAQRLRRLENVGAFFNLDRLPSILILTVAIIVS